MTRNFHALGLFTLVALGLLAPALHLIITGDFSPAFRLFYGLEEDSAIVDALLRLTGR